jgi:DNA-binding GntR family transcriptional regulator
MERIDVQTLADLACDTLERAILDGSLKPGAALGEADLAGQLGISRGPLREAINRLEGRRLVQRVPHVGVRVVDLSDWEVSEIFAMREVLEGLACRLASQHMTAAELDALEACAEFRHRKVQQGARRASDDFHVRVAEGSRNTRLIEYLCVDMYSLLRLYRIRSGSTPMRAGSSDEHREIVATMRARDGDAAERLMRAHVARARLSLGLDADVTAPPQAGPGRRVRRTATGSNQ